jgi:hypothetical protein
MKIPPIGDLVKTKPIKPSFVRANHSLVISLEADLSAVLDSASRNDSSDSTSYRARLKKQSQFAGRANWC